MIINMEIEDIGNEYAHNHISIQIDRPDTSHISGHGIIRVSCRNVEIILKLESLLKQRYILHLKVYEGHSVEMNDIINLYKCIYYKERYKQLAEDLVRKEKVFALSEEEIRIKEDSVENYKIMLTSISEIFSRYYLRYQTTKFNIDSDSDNIIESEYTNY